MIFPSEHPSPLPLGGPLASAEIAEIHRRDECATYGHCLILAAFEGWPGMSCAACSTFDPMVPAVSQVSVGTIVVPPRSTKLGLALEHIHSRGDRGSTDLELADVLGVTEVMAILLREELADLGYVKSNHMTKRGWAWSMTGKRSGGLVYGRMELEETCEPVVVQPGPGGCLELVWGRLQVEAARLLGWVLIPAVVVAIPVCPLCGAYLQAKLSKRGMRRRDGYCSGCEAHLKGTPAGIERVQYGPSRRASQKMCSYCGRLTARHGGACHKCWSLLPRLQSVGVSERRSRDTLRAGRGGLRPDALAEAVGIAYQVAVRVVELLDEPRHEQLELPIDDEVAA